MPSSGEPSWAVGEGLRGLRGLRACLKASLLLTVAVLAAPALPRAAATSLCRSLPVPEPDDCRFGLTGDYCGRTVCAKGPGERCGGPAHLHGRCGEGTHCKCGRCIGCSLIDFTCDLGSAVCS